ncbi:Uncharacterised protein [Salmonella enterica subsp. enterica serovar Bovismorbificans]|uniref:Uncharacterized protein n=1 Tax=Salmonella enterica subsp. enterica serovar Bovismorbificans TaxID=58097 RepID=A0A655DP62_SALET|nr:Uncharacterised protein [Salmonella enterica subsp. enterica serovar Bovismorbificans]
MQRLRQSMADARYRANQVGARAQMRDFTQILNAMAFCRHRVGIRIFHPACDFYFRGLDFETLSLSRRRDNLTCYYHGAACRQV